MTTEATTSAGEMPTATADSEAAAPEFITRKDFEAWTKKVNGELASFRKSKDPAPTGSHAKPAEPDGHSNGTAQRDADIKTELKLFREIGKLEAQLGDDLVAELEGDEDYQALSSAQQLTVLRAALRGRGATPTTEARGETPAKTGARRPQSSRAEPPATRDSVPRPRSQKEYLDLKKSDPKAAGELMKRDDFDPGQLPWTVESH